MSISPSGDSDGQTTFTSDTGSIINILSYCNVNVTFSGQTLLCCSPYFNSVLLFYFLAQTHVRPDLYCLFIPANKQSLVVGHRAGRLLIFLIFGSIPFLPVWILPKASQQAYNAVRIEWCPATCMLWIQGFRGATSDRYDAALLPFPFTCPVPSADTDWPLHSHLQIRSIQLTLHNGSTHDT